MKNSIQGWVTSMCAVAIAVLLITPAVAQAQSPTLRVFVPFEFHVGKVTLPSGTYMVQHKGSSGALSVSDRMGHIAVVITNGIPNSDPRSRESGALKFKVYEGQHFLSEVRWSGYSTAQALKKSDMELTLAKGAGSPTTKSIAAK